MNWKKLGSPVEANIPKSQFSISSMHDWGKLRIPTSAIFKNLNFRSLCELQKALPIPRFKSSNFKSIEDLGKVMP